MEDWLNCQITPSLYIAKTKNKNYVQIKRDEVKELLSSNPLRETNQCIHPSVPCMQGYNLILTMILPVYEEGMSVENDLNAPPVPLRSDSLILYPRESSMTSQTSRTSLKEDMCASYEKDEKEVKILNIGIFWVTNHFQYTIRIYLNCTYGKSTWIYCYSDVSNTLTIHKEKTLSLRPSVLEIKYQQTCILFRRNSLRTMKQICLQIHIHEHVPEQSRYRYTYKMISCTHVLP